MKKIIIILILFTTNYLLPLCSRSKSQEILTIKNEIAKTQNNLENVDRRVNPFLEDLESILTKNNFYNRLENLRENPESKEKAITEFVRLTENLTTLLALSEFEFNSRTLRIILDNYIKNYVSDFDIIIIIGVRIDVTNFNISKKNKAQLKKIIMDEILIDHKKIELIIKEGIHKTQYLEELQSNSCVIL